MIENIQIICKNDTVAIPSNLTLERFIEARDLNPNTVVVQCNGRIINRADYATHVLTANCTLEIIRFVGGG